MASSSNTITVPLKKHDVFISFRGEDTGANFTSFLHAALCRSYVETYIDYRIEKGDEVWAELEKAIKDSTLFLVVFSENYASSTWCLNELVEIMDCKKNGQVVVIPVFHHIEPSHVRKQTGSYHTSLAEHKKHGEEKMQKWKDALCDAANLSGFHSSKYRTESDLIEDITKDVLGKLDHKNTYELTCQFIPDENYSRIESLMKIDSREVQIIGLWGMGGIGKTTQAAAIFQKVSSQYEGSCFLENVTEESNRSGFNNTCKRLLSKLLRDKDLGIDTSKVIPSMVMRRLKRLKAFIVLDDVHTSELLENLIGVGRGWLGAGSIVIVTTRDKHVLISGGVETIHQVKEMNSQNSLRLFSLNAFNKVLPKEGYVQLSKRAIDYAKGHPLALKVLGSFLRYKSEIEWDSALAKLKEVPNSEGVAGFFKGYKRDRITMAPKYDLVSQFASRNDNAQVLVRLIRKWLVLDTEHPGEYFSLELCLLDSKGDRIACTIRKELVYIFDKHLEENEVYVLSKLFLVPNSGDYRASRHAWKLGFDMKSTIVRQSKSDFPHITYVFTPPVDVFSTSFDCKYLVDVIGIFTGVIKEREFIRKGLKSKLIIIELDNEGYRFKVTLFGDEVHMMNRLIESGHAINAVVVILFAKVKQWNKINNISNNFSTRLLFNPDIPEAILFKNKMVTALETPPKVLSQLQEKTKRSEIDDFLKLTPRATIKTMKEAFRKGKEITTSEESHFVLLATIYEMVDEHMWYYTACSKCTRKATPDSGKYYCGRCKKHVLDVAPSYCLRLRVNDESGTAALVMFDGIASEFLNISCADLLQAANVNNETTGLPNQLSKLQDQTLLFKVGCDRGSSSRFEPLYIVRRVTSNANLIKKFSQQDIVNGTQETVCEQQSQSAKLIGQVVEDVAQVITVYQFSTYIVFAAKFVIHTYKMKTLGTRQLVML